MPVSKIKRRRFYLSLPDAAFRSISILAQRENKTVPQYIQTLIDRDILKNGLPLFFVDYNESEH